MTPTPPSRRRGREGSLAVGKLATSRAVGEPLTAPEERLRATRVLLTIVGARSATAPRPDGSSATVGGRSGSPGRQPPAAHRRARAAVEGHLGLFAAAGVDLELAWTRLRRRHRHGPRRRLAGFDAVVAAGGDGTVFEVVNGLLAHPAGERPPLAVLPVAPATLLPRPRARPAAGGGGGAPDRGWDAPAASTSAASLGRRRHLLRQHPRLGFVTDGSVTPHRLKRS